MWNNNEIDTSPPTCLSSYWHLEKDITVRVFRLTEDRKRALDNNSVAGTAPMDMSN